MTSILSDADLKIVRTGTIFSQKENNQFSHSSNFNLNMYQYHRQKKSLDFLLINLVLI